MRLWSRQRRMTVAATRLLKTEKNTAAGAIGARRRFVALQYHCPPMKSTMLLLLLLLQRLVPHILVVGVARDNG
jgi:hypothetical protein